jgi:hypothetical protein
VANRVLGTGGVAAGVKQLRLPLELPAADTGFIDRLWERTRGRETGTAFFLTLAIATLPFWSVLLGHNTGMYGDINDIHVPAYVAAWRVLGNGHWPWWTPNIFAGTSMVGAGQYAVFYPVNAVFVLGNTALAYRIWMFTHLWLATAGAFAWSLRRYGSRIAAIVSGVSYACSGFFVLHLVHMPFIIASAWLPFVFLGVDLLQERWTTGRALLLAGSLAMVAFGGHPQVLWLVGIGAGIYALVCAVFGHEDARVRWSAFGRVAAGCALGLGLAAVQLLPMWLFSRTSVRPKLSAAAALGSGSKPHDLWTALFPYVFGGSGLGKSLSSPWLGGDIQHEVGWFVGCTVLALAVIAVVARWRDTRVLALVVVAAFALLMSLGGSTPFGHFAYGVVPLANQFRDWGRAALLVNFAIAMLAGAGMRAVLDAPRRYVFGLGIAAMLLAWFAFIVRFLHPVRKMVVGGSYAWFSRGLPIALFVLFVLGVALLTRSRRAGAIVVLVAVSFEVVAFAAAAEWRPNSLSAAAVADFYSSKPPSFGAPYAAPGGVDRWASSSYGFRNASLAKDMQGLNGYDPLLQKDFVDSVNGFEYDGAPTSDAFWQPGWLSDVLRVTTIELTPDHKPTDPSWRADGSDASIGYNRFIRDPRLPEAYLSGDVTVAPLTTIRHDLLDPSAPFDRTTFVEQSEVALSGVSGDASAGTVERADVLGSGRVVVDAQRTGLLVLSHNWEKGWHATVDGHTTPVLRANGLVLGIAVPPGHHVVHVWFRPPGVVDGAALTLLSLLLLLLIAPALPFVRRRWVGLRNPAGADAA